MKQKEGIKKLWGRWKRREEGAVNKRTKDDEGKEGRGRSERKKGRRETIF